MNIWIEFISSLNLSIQTVSNNEKIHLSLLCDMCSV